MQSDPIDFDPIDFTRKLAVLALHPHDPDAIGLHITLFDIDFLTPGQLAAEYGLPAESLDAHIQDAQGHRMC